jgi:hypothetical protein
MRAHVYLDCAEGCGVTQGNLIYTRLSLTDS